MHYPAEIIIPPIANKDLIEEVISRIMNPYSENNDETSREQFWDWYVLGGRFRGNKLTARIGEKRMTEFWDWCKEEGIMVSAVTCGKQSLQPANQIFKVDEAWARITGTPAPCMVFAHGEETVNTDICTIAELPKDLETARVIIAESREDGAIRAAWMMCEDYWNGTNYVKSDWDKTVLSAIQQRRDYLANCAQDYRPRVYPADNWLCVTVDYHS